MFSHAYNMSVTGQTRPQGQSVLFLDTFTGDQGISIANHTPDVGTGWDVLQYTGSGTILINNNGMYLSQLDEFTSAIAKPRISERTNYAVEFDFKITYEQSSSDSWDLYFYLQDGPSIFQGFGFEFYQGGGVLTLYYWSNDDGINSSLELTLTPLETHTFRLEVEDASWRFLIDGTELVSNPLSTKLHDPLIQFDFGNYSVSQSPVAIDRVTVFQTPAVNPLTPFSGYLPSMTGVVTVIDDMTGGSTLIGRPLVKGPQWLPYVPELYSSPTIVGGVVTNTPLIPTGAQFAKPRGEAAELTFNLRVNSTETSNLYWVDINFGSVLFRFRYFGDTQTQELMINCPSSRTFTFSSALTYNTNHAVKITYTTCETRVTIDNSTVVHTYHTYNGPTYNSNTNPNQYNMLLPAAPSNILTIDSFQIKEYSEQPSAAPIDIALAYSPGQLSGTLVGIASTTGLPIDFRFAASGTHTSNDGYLTIDASGNVLLTDVGAIGAINTTNGAYVYAIQCKGSDGNWSSNAQITINVSPV